MNGLKKKSLLCWFGWRFFGGVREEERVMRDTGDNEAVSHQYKFSFIITGSICFTGVKDNGPTLK